MTTADSDLLAPTATEPAAATELARRYRVAVTAVAVVPFLTAVTRAVLRDWFPIGDNALLFIRTRDVLTNDHPFLGSWTSASLSVGDNMNNPGAMYDWLVAPFAHVLSPGPAAAVGVALINIVMVCVISAAAHRVGGWAFQRWALLVAALMAWSMGSELLIDIWQANALIFAFIALLIIGIGVAAGDDGMLPWAAVIASLLLQTHISYAYIFAFWALAIIGVRWWQRRAIDSSRWRRPAGISAGLIAVLWAPSFWEQFFGTGTGNMSRLLRNSSGGEVSLGLDNAARIVASLAVRPPFWGRSGYSTTVVGTRLTERAGELVIEVDGLVPTWVAVPALLAIAALLCALALGAHRSNLLPQAAGGMVAAVVALGAVLALSRLTVGVVGLSPHHVRWAWPLVAFVHLVVVWLAVEAWTSHRDPDRAIRRVIDAIVVGLIVVVSLLNVPFLAQPSGPTTDIDEMAKLARIEPQLARLDGFDPVLFDVSTLRPFEPNSATVKMWLQERGITFRVDDDAMVRQLGEPRRADGSEPTRIFQLEGGEARIYAGPECRIAEASWLTPEDEKVVEAMITEVADDFARSIGTSPEAAFDAIVRREFDPFDDAQRARFDVWTDSAYALFAEGEICATLDG